MLILTVIWALGVAPLVRPALFTVTQDSGWWEVDQFFNTPHVITHRGDLGGHPENTMSAFEFAYSVGARLIELDVRITSDRVPIVFHDPDFKRTTNGEGKVARTPWHGYAETLDAATYFSGTSPEEGIPTVDEVFSWLANRTGLVLWVHVRFDKGDDILADAIRNHGVQSQVIIQLNAGESARFDRYQDCLGRAMIVKEPSFPFVLYNLGICRTHNVQFVTVADEVASKTLFDFTERYGIRVMLTRNFDASEEHIMERFSMGAWGYIVNSAVVAGALSDFCEPTSASTT